MPLFLHIKDHHYALGAITISFFDTYITPSEVQIDGRPRRLSFFPGDKFVQFTGPYGRPNLSVKSLKIND